jgi:nucleotide-binding universal stress UspA family protein
MAKKIEKVLVPLDFSEYAEKAYEFAKEQGWKVIVLHVLEEGLLERIYPYFSAPGFDFEDFVRERKALAERELEKYDAEKKIVKVGKSWKEIVKTADEEDVDLIVMTERGSGEEKIFGSCADRVVKHANKPVLIVR